MGCHGGRPSERKTRGVGNRPKANLLERQGMIAQIIIFLKDGNSRIICTNMGEHQGRFGLFFTVIDLFTIVRPLAYLLRVSNR